MQERDLIRAATFNVRYGTANDGPNRWEERKGIFMDAVRDLAPHVMGVQECLPFQGDSIKMAFPYMDRVGVGRYHEAVEEKRPHESRSGEHCDIWFDARRYLAESCGAFWHSDTPEMPGSITWGNNLPRMTTWAILSDRLLGGRLAFFCTHYHGGEPCCTKATDLSIRRIREIAGKLPRILVGDFNLTPDNANHARYTGKEPDGAGLVDVWQALGNSEEGAGSCHDNFCGVPKTRIDWILIGGGLKPVSVKRSMFQKDGRFPSDHFPILAELALK